MLSFSFYKQLLIVLTFSLLSACATTSSDQQTVKDERDPLEFINRPIWTFNWDYADKYVFKPASDAYVAYIPKPIRSGVYNAALNLNEPFTIVNNLLQLKFHRAAKTTGRFVLNSTVGLLGWFDVARHAGLTREEEEFGEVLATYGVGEGPYLMMPLLGPTSVRDEVGDFVDDYYWPLSIIDFWPNVAIKMVVGLELRAELSEQEALLKESLDPYEFVKNAYFQNIRYRVYDGNPPLIINQQEEQELDDLLEEL
ncbi:VacJ family lipoprotein [Thalassotalea aquiviva]|uniref:MlaA family lipoprotein n=1 Tax=Thalassotalea aquiviva TaxID=3242415 RepID=UPI00352A7BFE